MSAEAVNVQPDVDALDRTFDYEVPAALAPRAELGAMVRVELHGRRVNGWIVGPGSGTSATLRPLLAVRGIGPPPRLLELCRYGAWRWAGPVSRFLRAASPERNITALLPRPALSVGAGAPAEPLRAFEVAAACDDPFPRLEAFVAAALAARPSASVLLACPTTAYASRLAARLDRAGLAAVGPGPEQWRAARSGWPVVVGARSVALAPVPALAGVAVVDAHDPHYFEQGAPTWWAVRLLAEQAAQAQVPFLVTSPLATPELRHLVPPTTATWSSGARGWPVVSLVDLREEDPRHGLLSAPLVAAARAALADASAPGTVCCVLNRTGRAKLLSCRTCAALVTCEDCGRAMALNDGVLTCPACGASRPARCASCGGVGLKLLRPGVARLAEELAALLRVPVEEVTASSVDPPGAAVLIGTEALLHRVRRARVVCFLDVDQHLLGPRYGAEDATWSLLVRAARLVGPRGAPGAGKLLVQTRLPEHPVLTAVVSGNPEAFFAAEATRRAARRLPPASALGLLRGPDAAAYAVRLTGGGSVEVIDLEGGVFWLRASDGEALADALAATPRGTLSITVAVEPDGL